MVLLIKERGESLKKSIFIMLTAILSVNILFSIDEASTFLKESVQIQNMEKKLLAEIQPTGIWFTEEDIIDEG